MAIVERRALPQHQSAPGSNKSTKVCSFWQQNRCLKGSSCEFLHADNRLQTPETRNEADKRAFPGPRVISLKRASQPDLHPIGAQQQVKKAKPAASAAAAQPQRICKYWQDGRCKFGEKCIYWHPKEAELQSSPPKPFVPKVDAEKKKPAAQASKKEAVAPALAASRLNKCGFEPGKKLIQVQRSEAEKNTQALAAGRLKKPEPEMRIPAAPKHPVQNPEAQIRTRIQAMEQRAEQQRAEQQQQQQKQQQQQQQPSGLELVTTLKAHDQSITGIALLVDSALLFTGSSDETVKAWNCKTGQCLDTIKVQGGVNSIISASGWVFVAVGREIKAWNPKLASGEATLSGATGDITALATGDGFLIAGTKQGTICGWNFIENSQGFSSGSSFVASSAEVSALRVLGARLYSGFSDGSIKLWDLTQLKCLQSVSHSSPSSSPVTGLTLCSKASVLVSSSDEGVIRSWSPGSLEVGSGSEKLAGGVGVFEGEDGEGKPVLGCSFRDSGMIKMFGLPLLEEKGRFWSGAKVTKVVSSSEAGLVFVGDDEGSVKVWRWIQK